MAKKTPIERWLQKGFKKGWISEGFCYFHEAPDLTDEENWEVDEYGDTCVPCVRVWLDEGKA